MEFQIIYMEKSREKIFALRAFHPILTHCLGYYNCYNFYHVCGYKEMQGDHIQSTYCDIVCSIKMSHCSGMSIMEKLCESHGKSWKNHGI